MFDLNGQNFPRRTRLSRKNGFGQVLRNKPDLSIWFSIYHRINKLGISRFGITVAKNVIPSAVERNRYKRIARECFRKINKNAIPVDIVVKARRKPRDTEWTEFNNLLFKHLENVLTNNK